jgi:epoxyqueuosine reductase QueG
MDSETEKLAKELRKTAEDYGARAFGIADLEALKRKEPRLLHRVPGDYSRAVVFGMRLQRSVLEDITDRPTPLYFHHYRQLNYQLDRAALVIADKIQGFGFRALAIPASQVVEKNPPLGHISHKLLGWAAGVGFIGRCTLLVHPRFGAEMRYVSVLTDAPLRADTPFVGECATCKACIEVCPAGAVKERREDFDLEACYRKLTEFTKIPYIGQHICGVCVKACAGKDASRG